MNGTIPGSMSTLRVKNSSKLYQCLIHGLITRCGREHGRTRPVVAGFLWPRVQRCRHSRVMDFQLRPELIRAMRGHVPEDTCNRLDDLVDKLQRRELRLNRLDLLRKVHDIAGNDINTVKHVLKQQMSGQQAEEGHHCGAPASSSDAEAPVVTERTVGQQNADERKHVIDLNLLDAKRAKAAPDELQSLVGQARIAGLHQVENFAQELIQPALDDYRGGKIDSDTLDQRKVAARSTAEAEHPGLRGLEAAFAAYTQAMNARIGALKTAEEAVANAIATEDAAELAVQNAAQALLQCHGGSAAPHPQEKEAEAESSEGGCGGKHD